MLEVRDLEVSFPTRRGTVHALRGVGFSIEPRQVVGLVGESGSGKSVTASAIIGLIRPPGRVTAGDVLWNGRSLLEDQYIDAVRAKGIALIPQEPTWSLNPLAKIGRQLEEVLRYHRGLGGAEARSAALELLDAVEIPAARRCASQYPFELSGGMCQRVLIALALVSEPDLIIADEPTSSLDVTIQKQIIELISKLRDQWGLSMLFITHDLGLVAEVCDSVIVMYSGLILESGNVSEVFGDPSHPYTEALLRSRPVVSVGQRRLPAIAGSPPNALAPPQGCPFHPRCEFAETLCEVQRPALLTGVNDGGSVACWKPLNRLDEHHHR